jgi:hypothetical protein
MLIPTPVPTNWRQWVKVAGAPSGDKRVEKIMQLELKRSGTVGLEARER